MSAAADRPEVNARVAVRLECCQQDLASRVEDTEDGRLALAAPAHPCEPDPPRPGRRVRVRWVTEHAIMALSAVLVETRRHPVAVWVVDGQGEPERVQRRHYVRVSTRPFPLLLRAGARQCSGWLLDLSEGGLRCTCDGPVDLGPGDRLVAWLKLGEDGPNLALAAEVVRTGSGEGGRQTLACRFVDVPAESADRLREYVFRLQLRERRRQAGLE